MRLVQHANTYPHRCAGLPYMGNSNSQGFIDTGTEMPQGGQVYLSFELICEAARMLGWQGPNAVHALEAEIASKQVRIEQLEEEVKSADKFAEAAEYTLGRFGQQVRQKPGPKGPRKKEVAA